MGHRRLQLAWRTAGLACMAALLAGVFLGIGEWYKHNLNENKTIVLDKSLFQEQTNSFFSMDSIVKRHTLEPIREAKLLDGDQLLIITENKQKRMASLSTLDLATNRVESVLQETNLENLTVSPNGTRLVFDAVRTDGRQTVAYDLNTRSEIGSWDNGGAWPILLDDYRYVDLDQHNLRFLSIAPDDIVFSISLKALEQYKINAVPGIQIDTALVKGIKPSLDSQQVYMQFYLPEHSKSVLLSINRVNRTMTWIASGDIMNFVPIDNDRVLIYGRFAGVEGLYSAVGLDKITPLSEGSFNHLTFNPTRNAISYANQTEDGRWKVMAAKLDTNGLSDEFTVYSDPGYVRSLQWSPDGTALICISEGISGSDIYQFRLSRSDS